MPLEKPDKCLIRQTAINGTQEQHIGDEHIAASHVQRHAYPRQCAPDAFHGTRKQHAYSGTESPRASGRRATGPQGLRGPIDPIRPTTANTPPNTNNNTPATNNHTPHHHSTINIPTGPTPQHTTKPSTYHASHPTTTFLQVLDHPHSKLGAGGQAPTPPNPTSGWLA